MDTRLIALVNFKSPFVLEEGLNCAVVVKGKKIENVIHHTDIPKEADIVDLGGCWLSPGFIDLLPNGAGGGAFGVTAQYDDLLRMGQTMMEEGTTGFLVSAPSNSYDKYVEMFETLWQNRNRLPANYLGMHLEGPFFHPEFKGAHDPASVRRCEDNELKDMLEHAHGQIKMMTLAPEMLTDHQIELLEESGVRLSFGHSGADYDQALHFLQKPHRSVTHLYNAMTPIHHRKPGHIPAIFHVKPMTGIIADGVHVAYPMVTMAYEVLGLQLYLITDRFTECDLEHCSYRRRGNYYVRIVDDGVPVMAGSALTMMKAVQNCVEHVGIPMGEALYMATANPAKWLGVEHQYGQIKKDYTANLVVFDDNWQVKRVMFEGAFLSGY